MWRPRLGSLRTRILVLATVPLAAMITALILVGHETARSTLTRTVRDDLRNAARVFVEVVEARRAALVAQARVTAGDPRFFATFSISPDERGDDFVPTLDLLARDFIRITDADVFEIFDAEGTRLARCDRIEPARAWSDAGPGRSSVAIAATGTISSDHFVLGDEAMLVVDVPVFVAGHLEAVLRLGRAFDDAFARKIVELTGSSFVLRGDQRIIARSGDALPIPVTGPASKRGAEDLLTLDIETVVTDRDDALHAVVDLPGLADDGGAKAILSRDLHAQLAPLRDTEHLLAAIGVVTLLVTLAGATAIAMGVTHPLRSVVTAARRLTDGDYDAPVPTDGADEVAELARGFDDMRRELRAHVAYLEDVDKMKNDFLALAGHELKTPLTVIISFNDLIQSGALGDLPDEILETNGIIKDQLSRLDRMVQDILDLTALEAKRNDALYVEDTDLSVLVRATLDAQESWRAERDIVFDVDLPDAAPVRGDQRLLTRAIRALLDNAVRFTPDAGRVSLRIDTVDDDHSLHVEDTGIGIEPDQLRWIASKFFERGDIDHHRSGDLEFGARGLGLGLALTHAIVDAHGGRLDADSTIGIGSHFALRLPASVPCAAPTPVTEVRT